MEILLHDYLMLAVAALLAGLIDAAVGGGGLVQVPALFSAFPLAMPATLFGTNKLASIWGTAFAARSFARRIPMDWSLAVPASLAALVFSLLGTSTLTQVPVDYLRKALPFVLLLLVVYVARQKDFGQRGEERFHGPLKTRMALLVGAGVGFYDGFFGPGTGSFLIFLFVRVFGQDFLAAAAVSKVVNVACNLSALALFAWAGHVLWPLGLLMAACNVLGSIVGTRLAVRGGASYVRLLFLLVVGLLIMKTAADAFF